MNEHDAITRIKRLSHSINCADEIAEVIERLIKERDEARRVAAYQYAKHHNGDEDTLVKNFFEFRGWTKEEQ